MIFNHSITPVHLFEFALLPLTGTGSGQMAVDTSKRKQELRRCVNALESRFGLTVRGAALAVLLGHGTTRRTLQRARAAGKVTVPLHPMPGKVGVCATAVELAKWLMDEEKDWKNLITAAVAAAKKDR